MILVLLKHGADINQRSSDGRTALMWAATKNNCDMIQFLIDNGADPKLVDNQGLNVLDICVIRSVY
jgi:ankyrin repeat protein